MQSLDHDGHIAILTEMASDYHQAGEQLEKARRGLAGAVADAKAVGLGTAEIVRITGWSRSQIKNIAAYMTPTVATDQPAGTPTDQVPASD